MYRRYVRNITVCHQINNMRFSGKISSINYRKKNNIFLIGKTVLDSLRNVTPTIATDTIVYIYIYIYIQSECIHEHSTDVHIGGTTICPRTIHPKKMKKPNLTFGGPIWVCLWSCLSAQLSVGE